MIEKSTVVEINEDIQRSAWDLLNALTKPKKPISVMRDVIRRLHVKIRSLFACTSLSLQSQKGGLDKKGFLTGPVQLRTSR